MKIWKLVPLSLFAMISMEATPIWAKFIFTANGTVNGTPFTNTQVTITEEGGGVTNPSSGVFELTPTLTVIQVAGFSLATVTDTVYTMDKQTSPGPGLFFGVGGSTDLFEFGNGDPTFASYDFSSPLGPIPDGITDASNFASIGINTSLGVLIVTSFGQSGNGTYLDSIPEPGALGTALCGLGGLVAVGMRRRARRRKLKPNTGSI